MRTILSTIVVLVSSATLVSAEVVAKSHEEVTKQSVALMAGLMGDMSKITDEKSAKAFAATLPAAKEKLRALLKAAQALPEPTKDEKNAWSAAMEAGHEENEPAFKAMMESLSENPDADAIGVIIHQFMADEEMQEIGNAISEIYQVKEFGLAPTPDTE